MLKGLTFQYLNSFLQVLLAWKEMETPALKKISIIVPAYNKGIVLFSAINNLIKELKLLNLDFEIVVVNDGSKDQTLEEAIRAKKFNGNTDKIKIYNYDLNCGKGFAIQYGFTKTSGDIVGYFDGDLDLPAKNLRVLLAHMLEYKAEIAVGSKRHPLSKVYYPPVRRFYSKCYQLLIRLLFNVQVSDTQVGCKLFKREVLEEVLPRLVVKAFAFDLELLVVAKHLGFKKIIESPITLNYQFNSTVGFVSIINILTDTFAILYRKAILKYYDLPEIPALQISHS